MRKWVGMILIIVVFFCSSLPSVQADAGKIIYEQEPNSKREQAQQIPLGYEVAGKLSATPPYFDIICTKLQLLRKECYILLGQLQLWILALGL